MASSLYKLITVYQILNRTNNIFELVTVEAVMHEKAPDKRNELLRLSDETENTTEKNLRLKGKSSRNQNISCVFKYLP